MAKDGDAPPPADPRARRSKQALENALLELAEVDDLARLSISDITKRAGVSRSTFYEHYTDVHDLAAAASTRLFDQLVTAFPIGDPNWFSRSEVPDPNPLVPFFAHFAEHAQLYRSLLGPDGSARVINFLLGRLRVKVSAILKFATEVSPTPDFAAESVMTAGALLSTVVNWLGEGCATPPEELAALLWVPLGAAAAANHPGALPVLQRSARAPHLRPRSRTDTSRQPDAAARQA